MTSKVESIMTSEGRTSWQISMFFAFCTFHIYSEELKRIMRAQNGWLFTFDVKGRVHYCTGGSRAGQWVRYIPSINETYINNADYIPARMKRA